MNFGQAIEALKQGKKASREHWTGAFIYLTRGRQLTEARDDVPSQIIRSNGSCELLDHIDLAEGDCITCGWNPHQNDVLADDWEVFG